MSLSQEGKENDATGPYIDCVGLVLVVEQGFWRHVAFGSDSVLDLHVLLKVRNFLDLLVVGEFARFAGVVVDNNLRKAEID